MHPEIGKIETRTWKTNYRGPVLMCGSQKPYTPDDVYQITGQNQYKRIAEAYKNHDMFRFNSNGHALFVGQLVDCRPMKEEDENKCFVQYHPGLLCHVYEDVMPIHPIPFKGAQKWRNVSEDFKKHSIIYLD